MALTIPWPNSLLLDQTYLGLVLDSSINGVPSNVAENVIVTDPRLL